jgi:hypothetical protein
MDDVYLQRLARTEHFLLLHVCVGAGAGSPCDAVCHLVYRPLRCL